MGTYWKLIAVAAVVGGAFIGGYKVADWRFKSTMLGAVQEAQEQYKSEAKWSAAIGAELERERAKQKVVVREVVKEVARIVDRPVYRSDCIDDDGLRAANRAIDGEGAGAR